MKNAYVKKASLTTGEIMSNLAHINTAYNLVVDKYKKKKFNEVIRSCKEILKKKKSADFFHVLGMALYRIENFEDAIYYLNEAIKIKPNNYNYYLDLGDVHRQKKSYEKALQNYLEVLRINPKSEKAYFSLGQTFGLLKNFHSALKMGISAAALNKNNNEYKTFVGKCLEELHEFNEALKIYDEILINHPNNKQAMLDKSELLRKTFKYEEALEISKFALEIDKNDINCYLMMASILRDMKRINEAIEFLNEGLKIKPNSAQAQFNKGVLLLQIGDFQQGWKLYESRWLLKNLTDTILITKNPWWKGEKKSNLFIWSEQGIGDEVMFSSMFNEIKNTVNKLTISTDRRLIPIFSRTFPDIIFIQKGGVLDDSKFSHHLPMGSLAQFYRKDRADYENRNHAYLKTNIDLDNKFNKYFDKSENRKYIGISWKSTNPISGLKRSATLKDLIKYIGDKDAVYVNLQYGDVNQEIFEVEKNMDIKIINIVENDNKKDIDGLFSIIRNCDEVISIDNSTVHFAGSIGKKTEILLHESADFRWEINSQNANWYKSVKLTRDIIL